MPDERLSTWQRGLLSALWSFLQHPAAHLEDHLTGVEGRLRQLEARLVGDLKGAEHRLEEDFERVIRGRVAEIHARLETVKRRVVEDLKHELRRVAQILALAMACAVLALVGMIFALMAAWTGLDSFIGAFGASLVLAVAFLVASLVVFGLFRSVLHRSHPPPITGSS
jgi:Putative Actinobacterial Holin-X, holin superfamily III